MNFRAAFAVLALAFSAQAASAATLTLPSVTVTTSGVSTAITCNPTPAALVEPLAAGTVLFNCTVAAPAGWAGAVAISSGPQFMVTALVGNAFSVAVGAAALPAGTYAPGTLTSVP